MSHPPPGGGGGSDTHPPTHPPSYPTETCNTEDQVFHRGEQPSCQSNCHHCHLLVINAPKDPTCLAAEIRALCSADFKCSRRAFSVSVTISPHGQRNFCIMWLQLYREMEKLGGTCTSRAQPVASTAWQTTPWGPLFMKNHNSNCGVLALPPSHQAQSTKNPSPFMGVGQTQQLWGSSVTPFASGTKDKES